MKFKAIKTVLAGAMILIVCSWQSLAFSSMTAKEVAVYLTTGKAGGYIHRQITEEALQPLQIKKDLIDKIGDWNWRTDWDESRKSLPPRPNETYQPAHHFDRNEIATCEGCGTRHVEAFLRGAKFALEQKTIAVAGLKKEQGKTMNDTVEAIGHGLHALQDLFSHSNIVDLSPADLAALKNALMTGTNPPKTLKIAGYDLKKGTDIENVPNGVCSDTYDFGHDVCSKDAPEKNKESQKKIEPSAGAYDKNRPDRTKFDGARGLAVEFSRVWVAQIKGEAGPTAWQQLFDLNKIVAGRIQLDSLAVFFRGEAQTGIISLYEQIAHYTPFEENPPC